MPYMIEQSVLYTCEVSTTIEWLCVVAPFQLISALQCDRIYTAKQLTQFCRGANRSRPFSIVA